MKTLNASALDRVGQTWTIEFVISERNGERRVYGKLIDPQGRFNRDFEYKVVGRTLNVHPHKSKKTINFRIPEE